MGSPDLRNVPAAPEIKMVVPLSDSQMNEQADRLWKFIDETMKNEKGYNWITPAKVRTWYAKTMAKDHKITVDAMRDLMGRHVGFFSSLFDTAGAAYKVNIEDKGWETYCGDCRDADELIRKLSDSALIVSADGKGIWQALGATRIVWVDVNGTAEGIRNYMIEQVTEGIMKDPALAGRDEAFKKALIEKFSSYLLNGDFKKALGVFVSGQTALPLNDDMGTGNGTDPSKMKPYNYSQWLDPKFGEFVKQMASGPVLGQEKANKMLGAFGLSMLLNSAYSIKTTFDAEKKPFDQDAYDSIGKVYSTMNRLAKDIKRYGGELSDIEGRIGEIDAKIKELENNVLKAKAEEAEAIKKSIEENKAKKAGLEKKAAQLRERIERDAKMLDLSKKFYRFICLFAKNGGMEYQKALEGPVMGVNMDKVGKKNADSVVYWVNLFKDPRNLLSLMEKKPGVSAVPGQQK